jgi:hypothetical protein
LGTSSSQLCYAVHTLRNAQCLSMYMLRWFLPLYLPINEYCSVVTTQSCDPRRHHLGSNTSIRLIQGYCDHSRPSRRWRRFYKHEAFWYIAATRQTAMAVRVQIKSCMITTRVGTSMIYSSIRGVYVTPVQYIIVMPNMPCLMTLSAGQPTLASIHSSKIVSKCHNKQ